MAEGAPLGESVSKNPAELGLELYNVLAPYPSEVRLKAIQSAMVALGETGVPSSLRY